MSKGVKSDYLFSRKKSSDTLELCDCSISGRQTAPQHVATKLYINRNYSAAVGSRATLHSAQLDLLQWLGVS